LIIVGDVTISSSRKFILQEFPSSFYDLSLCMNLEGAFLWV